MDKEEDTAALHKWREGLAEEVLWRRKWFAGALPQDTISIRDERLKPNRPFPNWLREFIAPEADEVRVLEVGGGPITILGNSWPGRKVTIVPIDPLAEEYRQMLDELGLTPPIRTIYGRGENLVAQFGTEQFHLAYASNSLDHTVDPIACYQQMLAVLKPGGCVATFHLVNEGLRSKYRGLHQWNFDLEGERVFVWNNHSRKDLLDCLTDVAEFSTRISPGSKGPMVRLVMRKAV